MDNHYEQGIEELKQYLLEWVYEYGNPFTEIRYVFDSCEPLEVIENAQNRVLYEQAYPYHDEPLYDTSGKVIGIQTVVNREKERDQKPLTDLIKEKLAKDIEEHEKEIARLKKDLKMFD